MSGHPPASQAVFRARFFLAALTAIVACVPSYGTNSAEWERNRAIDFNQKQAAESYRQMKADYQAASERNRAMWSDFAQQQQSARRNREISQDFEMSERRREAAQDEERRREQQAIAFAAAEKVRQAAEEARARRQAWENAVHASPEAALAEVDHNVLLTKDDRSQLLTYWSTRGNGEATFRLAQLELQQGRKSTWIVHLKTAAEDQNYPAAWARMGDAYLAGDGVAPDADRAEKLYRQSAGKDFAGGFVGLAKILQARGTADTKAQVSMLMLYSHSLPSEALGDEVGLDYCLKLSAAEKAATFARLGEALIAGAAPFPKAPDAGYAYLYISTALPGGKVFKARREAVEQEMDPEVVGRTLWNLSRSFAADKAIGANLRNNWAFVSYLFMSQNSEADRKQQARSLAKSAAAFGNLEAQLGLAAEWERLTKGDEAGAEWAWFYYSIALLSPGHATPEPLAQLGRTRVLRTLSGLQRRHGAFLVGEFFEKDYQGGGQAPLLAEVWYRHAADLGDAEAMYRLSAITAKRAPAESARWKRQAAEAGSFEALVVEDNVKAFMRADPHAFLGLLGWLSFYADEGNDVAMLRLADLYEQRAQSPSDLVGTYRWLRFLEWRLKEKKVWYDRFFYAAGTGAPFDERGQLPESALPAVSARCAAVGAKLTPDQRARALAQLGEWFGGLFVTRLESPIRFPEEEFNDRWSSLQRTTKQWFDEAAKAGSARALYQAGELLNHGTDKPAALEYFRRAAAKGVTAAAGQISAAYLEGELVVRDPMTAQVWHWFESEHSTGDILVLDPMADPVVRLGADDVARARARYLEICESGREFTRDPVRLWALYAAMAATDGSNRLVAQQRDSLIAQLSPAQLTQARLDCYHILLSGGFGVSKNEPAAVVFLKEAAQAGSPEAECEMALHFQDAVVEGTPITQVQYDSVTYWLGRAIQHGNALACVRMGHWIRRVDEQNVAAPAGKRLRVHPDFQTAALARLESQAAKLGDIGSLLALAHPEGTDLANAADAARKWASLRMIARVDNPAESFLSESARKELAVNYWKGGTSLGTDTTRAFLWYSAVPSLSDDSLEQLRQDFLNSGGELAVSELVALQREVRIAGLEYLD